MLISKSLLLFDIHNKKSTPVKGRKIIILKSGQLEIIYKNHVYKKKIVKIIKIK